MSIRTAVISIVTSIACAGVALLEGATFSRSLFAFAIALVSISGSILISRLTNKHNKR